MQRLNRQPSLHSRLAALLSVGLVVLLNVLAVSPRLHALLHDQEQSAEHSAHGQETGPGSDHECAVTLFGHGITVLPFFCPLLLAQLLARRPVWRPRDWRLAARCRYWHLPSHAPPRA